MRIPSTLSIVLNFTGHLKKNNNDANNHIALYHKLTNYNID